MNSSGTGGSNKDQWASSGRESKFRSILSDLRAKRATYTGSNPYDSKVIQGVKELEKRALLETTKSSMSATQANEMEELALLDRLTELFNSRTFFKELEAEMIRARRYKRSLSLCIVHLDNFDEIVQENGSLTGDSVLKILANVVMGEIRDVDFPARYSRSEFSIIFPETDASGVALVAERIRQKIGVQTIGYNGQNIRITASLGVASFPQAKEHEELIAKAAQAAALAAQRGGDRVCSM